MSDTESPMSFALLQDRLYSAVIADILDDLGFRHQALNQYIRPLDPSSKLLGRARTIQATDIQEVSDAPYAKELEAVDSLMEGDVVVATTDGSTGGALWGELLSTAAISKGARGTVIDGFTRDSSSIMEMEYPVFCSGYSPLDSKGRIEVTAYGTPIRCGGVPVSTGDLVFGDRDGVVVIPEDSAEEVLSKAGTKAQGEGEMKSALQRGIGIMEAYRKYGIL